MFKKFRPLGDRILVKRLYLDGQDMTASGIIIPDTAKEKAQTAQVIAVGAGKADASGRVMPLQVQVNDIVYLGKYSGTDAGDDHVIVREDEVLGVVER
jgi:chaperonin GroES